MKREFLKELGISDDLIEKIMVEHGKSIQDEQSKSKPEIDQLKADLETAQKTIDSMASAKTNAESVQKQADDYKSKFEEAQQTLESERLQRTITDEIRNAGGKDIDYLIYKLGKVEKPKEIADRISKLKEELPSFFTGDQQPEPQEPTSPEVKTGGYKVVDNKLKSGENAKSYTLDQIHSMTPEEINQNWADVSAVLESQK